MSTIPERRAPTMAARVEPLYRDSEPQPPVDSDDELALHFAQERGDDWRYVAQWGTWFRWSGSGWQKDATLEAQEEVRLTCRIASNDANERSGERKRLASAKKVQDVLKLVRGDRRIAATTSQWDANPWLLNTPDVAINLKTGKRRPHHQYDYCTKSTAVAPGGDCPVWQEFLDRVTGGDIELQAYLQRMLGYCLTGDTSAHSLFFAYGTGANGKSVLVDTVAGILNDYHRTAPIETFTASHGERHPTELAMLQGARLVTAVETEEGRRWAESKIKSLTGGDKIAARYMRQDFFEYTPQFKLLIAGNHKPGLRSVDEAIRRRFNLLPFAVTIPPEERDPGLRDKLKVEWSGILEWMIQGCLDWQREKLSPPAAVTEATAAYLDAEDALSAWLEEECTRDPQAWSNSTDLFNSWKEWAERSGEHVGSARRFAQNLESRGLQPVRKKTGRGFTGLELLNRPQKSKVKQWWEG